jgi:FKBP-type peptidyl-prolyl cis-trans isomerase FkpA
MSWRSAELLAAVLLIAGCADVDGPGPPSDPATETYAASLGVNLSQMKKVSDQLYTQDLVIGTGAIAATEDSVSVTYTGWLVNGEVFFSNSATGPVKFMLGSEFVIDGINQGLIGMKVGGKRRLVIGSALGYGSQDYGKVPGRSTLVIEAELVAVVPHAAARAAAGAIYQFGLSPRLVKTTQPL